MNKKITENYLMIQIGWNDDGVLIPMSQAAFLKDAMYFTRETTKNDEGETVYVNTIRPMTNEHGVRTKIVSPEFVEAAIVTGKLHEKGD